MHPQIDEEKKLARSRALLNNRMLYLAALDAIDKAVGDKDIQFEDRLRAVRGLKREIDALEKEMSDQVYELHNKPADQDMRHL